MDRLFHNHLVIAAVLAGVGLTIGSYTLVTTAVTEERLVGLFLWLASAAAAYKAILIGTSVRLCMEAIVNTLPREKFDKLINDYFDTLDKGD